jgi:hypothetical protein
MAGRHSQLTQVIQPAIEDLTQIGGIGPAIERHLHDAGILTLAQLASLSANDIAATLRGRVAISARRIEEENWIGQARELAAKSQQSTKGAETPPPPPIRAQESGMAEVPEKLTQARNLTTRQRSAIFTVQLELHPDGSVRRTLAKHARTESGDEDTDQWSGWDADRLVSFIERRALLRRPPQASQTVLADTPTKSTQSLTPIHIEVTSTSDFALGAEEFAAAPAPPPEVDSMPLTPKTAPPSQGEAALSGVLRVCGLETAVVGRGDTQNVLRPGEKLHLRLMLDLSEVIAPPDTLMSYKAVVYAKQIGSPGGITLAEGTGNIKMAESAQVELTGRDLPSGVYRLTSITTLSTANALERRQLVAFLESGLIEVLGIA